MYIIKIGQTAASARAAQLLTKGSLKALLSLQYCCLEVLNQGGVEEACIARYRFFFVGQLPRQVVQRYRLVIVVVLLFHIKPVYVK